ncbi:DoxX family protein [Winslowiella iniecta]|uniref:DoxX family protein n=1 Tax=Winslowiella iniecta TaxID=1560201 RepID=A0A0L7SX31_9GAMM|nr:DoxX family protein [Winslowiella iniecta]KOC87673.1 DoxX family protein [Winslowiella iniecta]KOC90592.1 DoxX family protein [Winslowiella iniecta]
MPAIPVSTVAAHRASTNVLHWLLLLAICAAYLQGGLVKLFDFPAALAEMQHFGLSPAAPFAVAVIVLELGASLLILTGRWRWLAALALALFTLAATFMANRFWLLDGPERGMVMNAFFEHIGLVGALLYVALNDLREKA